MNNENSTSTEVTIKDRHKYRNKFNKFVSIGAPVAMVAGFAIGIAYCVATAPTGTPFDGVYATAMIASGVIGAPLATLASAIAVTLAGTVAEGVDLVNNLVDDFKTNKLNKDTVHSNLLSIRENALKSTDDLTLKNVTCKS